MGVLTGRVPFFCSEQYSVSSTCLLVGIAFKRAYQCLTTWRLNSVHTRASRTDREESYISSTKTNVMFSGLSEGSECNIEVKLCSHFTGQYFFVCFFFKPIYCILFPEKS